MCMCVRSWETLCLAWFIWPCRATDLGAVWLHWSAITSSMTHGQHLRQLLFLVTHYLPNIDPFLALKYVPLFTFCLCCPRQKTQPLSNRHLIYLYGLMLSLLNISVYIFKFTLQHFDLSCEEQTYQNIAVCHFRVKVNEVEFSVSENCFSTSKWSLHLPTSGRIGQGKDWMQQCNSCLFQSIFWQDARQATKVIWYHRRCAESLISVAWVQFSPSSH